MNENEVKQNWQQIKELVSKTFPTNIPEDWEVIHVIFENELTKKGNIYKEVTISLKSLKEGLNRYFWRIPLPYKRQTDVYGIKITDGRGEILDFKVKKYFYSESSRDLYVANKTNPDLVLIETLFPDLHEGDLKTLKIAYYQNAYATKIKSGLLSSLWGYSWTYKVVSKTRKYDHILKFPNNVSIVSFNGEKHSSHPFMFSIDGKKITIETIVEPTSGDQISGEITYRVEFPYSVILLNLVAGAIIVSFIRLYVLGKNDFNLVDYIILFLVPFIIITALMFTAKRILPSLR